jgi:two-component system, LytTR family, response regulator
MKAVIIDDELSARTALSELLEEYFPNLITILAKCDRPSLGAAAIRALKPDVVFLDVEMPEQTGFEMLKDLGFPDIDFHVIFSTGHSHYAMQAFRFSAVDFLLKPVKIEHLIEAVMKVKENMVRNNRDLDIEKYKALIDNLAKEEDKTQYSNRRIVLSTSDGTLFVDSDDILKLEADGNYTTLYFLNQKPIFIARKLGDFDDLNPFLRVHRSFSINPKHVVKMLKTDGLQLVLRDGSSVDVARGKKDDVLKFFKDFFHS